MVDLIPSNYKWQIAAKKTAYIIAKLLVSGLTAIGLGDKIGPDNLAAFQSGTTVVIAAGLELVHDWAKMKWPDKKWL